MKRLNVLGHYEQFLALPCRFGIRLQERTDAFEIGEFSKDRILFHRQLSPRRQRKMEGWDTNLESFRLIPSHTHRIRLPILVEECLQLALQRRVFIREAFLSKSHLIRMGATTTKRHRRRTYNVHTPVELAPGLLLRSPADLRPTLIHLHLLAQPQRLHDLVEPLQLVFPYLLEGGNRLDRDPVFRFFSI